MSSGRLRLIAGLLLSLLLHGALLWQGLAPDIARPGTGQAEAHRLQVVWVETPTSTPTPAPAPSPAAAAARPGPAPAPAPARRPDTAAVAPPSRQGAGAAKATEQAATAAAQAPVLADTEAARRRAQRQAMGRLLDSAAGREAVQSAARQGLVRPQIHAQREDPLASGMREAAQGDCMKGEFKGGGMGLLSLPMLAAAALKGECSR